MDTIKNSDLPRGFKAGTAAAGFKAQGRDDLGIILSDRDAVVAGICAAVFCCTVVCGLYGDGNLLRLVSGTESF